MNSSLIVLLLSAAVLSTATQSGSSASTTLRVNGTIDTFDASTRILTLSTSNGTVRFTVALATRIRQGWHRVEGDPPIRIETHHNRREQQVRGHRQPHAHAFDHSELPHVQPEPQQDHVQKLAGGDDRQGEAHQGER